VDQVAETVGKRAPMLAAQKLEHLGYLAPGTLEGVESVAEKVMKPLCGAAPGVAYGLGDDLGAAVGAAQCGVMAIAPKAMLSAAFGGTFIGAMLTPSPLNPCDGIVTDPVEAYRTSCAIMRPMSVSANEAAIHNLSHD
jgi:hypothetical protein